MSRVLVTGAAGELGSLVVERLHRHDHDVVAFVVEGGRVVPPPGVHSIVGDIRNEKEVRAALGGVQAVVHAATRPSRANAVDVKGAEVMAKACASAGVHLVYPSIVGADESSLRYHKAKWQAEKVIHDEPGLEWTIQRATQFHSLIASFASAKVLPLPGRSAVQPVAAEDVAGRLVGLVQAGPSGRVRDYGGPELMTFAQAVQIYKHVRGSAGRALPLPRLGPLANAVAGTFVTPDGDRGRMTFRDWLTG